MNINNLAVVLNSQQRRLRIISQILIRNVVIKKSTSFEIYFTIHHPDTKKEIYKSILLLSTTNPSWSLLCSQDIQQLEFLTLKKFCFKVWLKHLNSYNESIELFIDRIIDFNSLLYVGNEITLYNDYIGKCPNNIFIKLKGTGFYVLPDIIKDFNANIFNKFMGLDRVKQVFVPIELMINAYTIDQLNTMLLLNEQVLQSNNRILLMNSKVANAISNKTIMHDNVVRYEYIHSNLKFLQKSLLKITEDNQIRNSCLNDLLSKIIEDEIEIKTLSENIESTKILYKSIENGLSTDKSTLREYKNKLHDVQKNLLNGFQYIFPMTTKVNRIARFNELCSVSFPKIVVATVKHTINRFNRLDQNSKSNYRSLTNNSKNQSGTTNSIISTNIINIMSSIFVVNIEESSITDSFGVALHFVSQMVFVICEIFSIKPLILLASGYHQNIISPDIYENFANYLPNIDNYFHQKSPYFKTHILILYRSIEEIRFKIGIINENMLLNTNMEIYDALNSIFTSFGRTNDSKGKFKLRQSYSNASVNITEKNSCENDKSNVLSIINCCDYDEPVNVTKLIQVNRINSSFK